MNILFHNNELLELIKNLYTLTGIRADILDGEGKNLFLTGEHTSQFCRLIQSCPQGSQRCAQCDAQAVRMCAGQESIHFYRCHAGLHEAMIPILSDGVPIAFLSFGQLLDTTSKDSQWERTRATLDWWPGDPDSLRETFYQLHQYSTREVYAYAEVLKALASYIQLSGMIQTAERTDIQRLELYLDQHYMEKLSLASISADLDISRTKLCALAKRLSGGQTLSRMIAQRRVAAAKLQLSRTDRPIAAVAESVGITDYNYFTKIFRSIAGVTPSAFRKQHRHNTEKRP